MAPATSAGTGGGSNGVNGSARGSPVGGSANNGAASAAKPKSQPNTNGNPPTTKPPVPLSSMRSPAMDLHSVERRGQPTASKEFTKRSRPHGLEEAKTYTPTEEEFRDPFEYIRKITPEAREYGICKIIPPDTWNPEFAIDTEKFHFKTRKQELNSVEGSTRANLSYLDALAKFHKQQGTNLNRLPYVDKKPLDLYRLKKAVESRGGFDKVCKTKKWAEIGRDLGYSGKIMSSLSTSLKNSYDRWLNPYENYLRQAKPGVYHQLEQEYGGPLTPSPAPSPMKRSNVNTPSSLRDESPTRQATDALRTSLGGLKHEGDGDITMADAPPATSQPAAGGFKAINSSGFTAVNSGFTSVNRPSTSEPKSMATPRHGSPHESAKNTPDCRPSALGAANALKRQTSIDSLDSARKEIPVEDDGDNGNRRSKRVKKESIPTVAGSHMSMFRPSVPKIPRDESSSSIEKCDTCGKGEETSYLAICESCDHAYHGSCLDPPLKQKPDGEWNCPRCLVGDGQFGFEDGGIYSLKQFQEKASDFKQGYFENRMPFDPVLNCPRPVTEDDVEREFWKLVASIEETVEVEYGADIHCTTHGSGFPTPERNPSNPYSTDLWNLTNLPLHPESLFRHIKSDISGMTVPWVYVGMMFSTFCWHNEDHYAYSANYQHFGATKTWYGIPGADTAKFENAMREAVPELFETQPDLLFQLVTLLTPEHLKKAGVRVYALDQRAGQFVITFPEAYHAGFNHGFNFNEAVNFAPQEWEPYGLAGAERMQQFRRQPCFSHDELLWTAAEGTAAGLTIQTARWLAPALERIHTRELAQRTEFLSRHKADGYQHTCQHTDDTSETCRMTLEIADTDVPEEEYACCYCKSFAYLSRFKCLETGKILCLTHAGTHACCDMPERQRFSGDKHELLYRKTNEQLDETYHRVADKAHLPEAWEKKYEALLDEEAKPALKSLRNILNEGERIPYDLPSLPTLKEFVDRCNDWVEEATNYTVRKQQNRRKNDKVWQSGLRKSIGNSAQDQKEREMRRVDKIHRLIKEADRIGFDCPEIQQLQERANAISSFQERARHTLDNIPLQTQANVEELLEEGRSFNVDMPELDKLSRILEQLLWTQNARKHRTELMNLADMKDFIMEGHRIQIPTYNDNMRFYTEKYNSGLAWNQKAEELITAEIIHYPQLEALSNQVQTASLSVSAEILAAVDATLHKQREAQHQVQDLTNRSREADYTKRPKYSDVTEIMKKLEDLNSKPSGTLDLEKEQKRHEDWMRKGKKLFGKTNAPLHILKSHMDYVLERNQDCFDIKFDKPRSPAEPSSRAASEERDTKVPRSWDDPTFREVFCICRRTEAGMMIECELCHEWYHGKCLKIARGKVKEDDKYTCPICDWRVRIPRDAARPKLEDLIAWQDEIPGLPFQPDEEDVLLRIIENAMDFRKHISRYCNPIMATANEVDTQRFFLRKIEGAEILLSDETNFFRQELHKWHPVASHAPPILEVSKSTRKPRPTKLQKMLAQYGVDDPEDLPDNLKVKANSLKRKAMNAEAAAAAAANASANPAQGSTALMPPLATSPQYGPGSHHFFSKDSQPSTPALGGGSHGHPGHGSESSSSSRPGSSLRPGSMDVDAPSGLHHGLFMPNDSGRGPQFTASDPSLSLEDRLIRGGQDDVLNLSTDVDKAKALEILGRTDHGRKRAEEIFGRDVWSSTPAKAFAGPPVDQNPHHQNSKDVDRMFLDLTNDDEDDETKKERARRQETEIVTADSLEAERDAMDMEDSD